MDVAVGSPSARAARQGLQRVCVHGVPFIGVKSAYGLVVPQSVHVRIAGHSQGTATSVTPTCFGNAAAESFFAPLKSELLHRAVWSTRQHAKTNTMSHDG